MTSPAVGPFGPNYLYAAASQIISRISYVAAISATACIVDSLVRYFINILSVHNCPIDVKKLQKFFFFNTDNIFMNTIKATTQLSGFNQRLLMRQSNKRFPYSGHHWNEDDAIDTFFSSVPSHYGTAFIEIIVGIKTLLNDVYVIVSNSGLNISKVIKYCFRNHGITINIWSDNVQEDFMGSVRKLLRN